jgi:hypothetical protein
MGRFFTSFDEAWDYFLARTEALEWFYGQFPDDEDFVAEGWIVEPPREIKRAALNVQDVFAGLDWLAPIPEHFLHVWLGGAGGLGAKPKELRGSGSFEAVYGRVNCFHSAVVVEVQAPPLGAFVAGTEVDSATFLPHLTIGITRKEHDPGDLRRALLSLRNIDLGVSEVTELKRIRFPAGQRTLLRPWSVIETVPL